MEEPPQINESKALEEKLQEILVSGSLYQSFVYEGTTCHHNYGTGGRYGQLPKRIKMFCSHEKCESPTWWETGSETVHFGGDFIEQRVYTCRNCGVKKQYYHLIWQEHDRYNLFIKAGQWPALSIEPSPELAKALGPVDTKLYKKGLMDFKFGHGIGAIAYFRRVLENKINALLDLIVEAAQNAKVEIAEIVEIEKIKKSHRVEDRIDVALKILPSSLRPGGHNPLDKLYAPSSAGLHGESDDECLRLFSEARFVFEYLFKNLTESNEEARKYVERLSAPAKAKKTNEV